MTRWPWVSVALWIGLTGFSCELDVVEDPGFQFWCGEQLCEWYLREGEIARVPTWHEHDYAVELVGAPVHLEQTFATRVSGCVLVELIADVEADAMVTIAIDEDQDRIPEWVETVDRAGFQRMSWQVDVDVWGSNTSGEPVGRTIIRKDAEGRAVLSQLRISERCDGRREYGE